MKATGIVRKIDDLGRIVLPKELRKTMHIDRKDPMEIYVDEDTVILKKYEPACLFCGNAEDTIEYKKKVICKSCLKEMLGKEETA
ncbi:AbrB/MazE/SpoVT family DNA-binding domain-containing protein [Iocasia frigidifontis]|uniref:AbrB/MazE/SpoVT family DNA-binding domain-containing protein n=1 Tax=Iocasia fonsfrigidae TaxID=2682810 RepID=A0A8A7KK89_9FIRM|nr:MULTISPECIES: AbrB/MazE/SpoVT family DNA-binding domain-containing protein [Halanaerobiaceae]AZO95661.1 AbrB/MazE/SpoVT family DNA-binding domain-containing protein [Halocella sp. SP3-1]MTI60851.1 AbrB/MazE/SpoVT family DNA-binding domain-containing protein [Bacillota bacterium]QTL98524.1 AbrB/MazE/SpoVT family DNA-binding domain-containing protein [Iocasia fonsfrigidae]